MVVTLIIPPTASPYCAGTPPSITETCSIAEGGKAEEPLTLIPSIYMTVPSARAPLTFPLSPSRENTPPTVAATALADRFGIFAISSAVTVSPLVVWSLEIKGTL